MEKILIYPYNKCYEAVVRYNNMSNEIVSLVSPNGWGLFGKDVMNSGVSLKIENNFTNELSKCTAVWFVEDDRLTLPKKLLISKILEAVSNNKKILYTRYKNQKEFEEMQQYIPPELNITSEYMKEYTDDYEKKACYDLLTPVVVVLGVEENTDKFSVQVSIISELRENGYSVSGVSSRLDSEIIGIHNLPRFMIENNLTETEKIIKYNHIIKTIEVNEKPDIIVIGIPGGVVEFDNINHNNYGIIAYEISRAVSCDFGIVCIPYLQQMNVNYQAFIDEISYRYRLPVNVFHVAAVVEDVMELHETGKRYFVSLDRDFVKKHIILNRKANLFDILCTNDCITVVNKIIDLLSDNEIINI